MIVFKEGDRVIRVVPWIDFGIGLHGILRKRNSDDRVVFDVMYDNGILQRNISTDSFKKVEYEPYNPNQENEDDCL